MPHSTKGIHCLPTSRRNSPNAPGRRNRWKYGESSVAGDRSNNPSPSRPACPARACATDSRSARPSSSSPAPAPGAGQTMENPCPEQNRSTRSSSPGPNGSFLTATAKVPHPRIATTRTAAGERPSAASSSRTVRRIFTISLGGALIHPE